MFPEGLGLPRARSHIFPVLAAPLGGASSAVPTPHSHMCTSMHTPHTHTHACLCAYSHAHMCTHMHTHSPRSHTCMPLHTPPHTCAQACTHTHASVHTPTHVLTRMHTHSPHSHMHTCAETQRSSGSQPQLWGRTSSTENLAPLRPQVLPPPPEAIPSWAPLPGRGLSGRPFSFSATPLLSQAWRLGGKSLPGKVPLSPAPKL